MIDQTPALQANAILATRVKSTDPLVQRELQGYSRTATAKWDLQEDKKGGQVLLLTLRDPLGFASDQFAPEELRDPPHLAERVHRLFSDLLQSARRASVPVLESRLSAEQLEALRVAMNADPALLAGRPRLQNQVLRINGDGSFTVRDFAIEVDADPAAIDAAKGAVIRAGLTPKSEPLAARSEVSQAVRTLVDAHRRDPNNPPRLVLWFRRNDPKDVHLLEIADDVADLGDGALDGVALGAGTAVPGARSIVIYLAAPSEVHKAFEVNPGHPAIQAMMDRSGQVVYPPGDWQAVIDEFPEIVQQPVP